MKNDIDCQKYLDIRYPQLNKTNDDDSLDSNIANLFVLQAKPEKLLPEIKEMYKNHMFWRREEILMAIQDAQEYEAMAERSDDSSSEEDDDSKESKNLLVDSEEDTKDKKVKVTMDHGRDGNNNNQSNTAEGTGNHSDEESNEKYSKYEMACMKTAASMREILTERANAIILDRQELMLQGIYDSVECLECSKTPCIYIENQLKVMWLCENPTNITNKDKRGCGYRYFCGLLGITMRDYNLPVCVETGIRSMYPQMNGEYTSQLRHPAQQSDTQAEKKRKASPRKID